MTATTHGNGNGAGAGGREKRRFPRYDVQIPVFLRKKTGDVRLVTADVSRHGAFIRTDQSHPLRQLVQLRFRLPDEVEIDAMCMVARWLGPDSPRGPGIGVDFFALSKEAKNAWERFLGDLRLKESARGFDVAHTPTGTVALPPNIGVPLPASAHLPTAVGVVLPANTNTFSPLATPSMELQRDGSMPPTRTSTLPRAATSTLPQAASSGDASGTPDWMEPTDPTRAARRKPPPVPAATPMPTATLPTPVPAAKGAKPPPPPADEEMVAADSSVVMLKLPDRAAVQAFVENEIGRGGMFLKTLLVKQVGEKVEVVLVHPETDEEFHLDGTVVRRVVNGPPEQRGLGIFFKSLAADAHDKLVRFAESGVEVMDLGQPITQRQVELEANVAREPDSAEALEALGSFLLDEEGDLGGALTALTRALVLCPSQISIHASLARAYRRIGDHVKVRAHERVAEALMQHQDRMKVRLGVGDDA